MLVDSHCHLTDPRLFQHRDGGLEGVLQRATDAGVTQLITIGTSLPDIRHASELASRHAAIWFAGGFHPAEVNAQTLELIPELATLLRGYRVKGAEPSRLVAVGETGIDLHWHPETLALQQRAFALHLELAAELGLPVVIHARRAFGPCMDVLAIHGFAGLRAVFHCFAEGPAEVNKLAELSTRLGGGACITASFTGVVTYKNAATLRAAAEQLGPEQIMLETDAPYLSPEPLRHIKVCEPAFLARTAECLDRHFGLPPGRLAALAGDRARWFFSLPHR